jgi:hypothetical protein
LAVSWIYLLDAAILLTIIYFLYTREEDRGAPLRWFTAWLALNALTNVLMFCSRAIPDRTISLSFWLVACCAATVLVLVGLFFARSFHGGNDFLAVFWTVPAFFSLAFILLAGDEVSIYEEGVWRFNFDERTAMLPVLVLAFYAVASLVYLCKLYLDVRKEGSDVARRGVAYLLIAFLVIFLTNMASPYIREYVNPLIPMGEVGGTMGALIIALNLSWMRAHRERKQEFM